MAEFSNKIIDAYYINSDYSVIEILFKDDNDKIHAYAIQADPEQNNYKEFLAEGWDLDRLVESTAEYKRRSSASLNTAIQIAADELVKKSKVYQLEQKHNEIEFSKDMDDEFFNMLIDNNKDKEFIFKFKLWALQLDIIKKASKEVKTNMRKAKSILDGMEIINGVEK